MLPRLKNERSICLLGSLFCLELCRCCFWWIGSIPPLWQRGARGNLPKVGVPKSPHPPFHKGGKSENCMTLTQEFALRLQDV